MAPPTDHDWKPRPLSRAAGALYLVIIVCGVWTQVVVRGSIAVAGDPAATAANLLAHQALFRWGFAAEMLMAVADVSVTVLLYLLLCVVSRPLALAAAAFHLVSTAVLAANTLTAFGALLLLLRGNVAGGSSPAAFEGPQLDALVQHAFSLHGHGYSLALVFFGVNCLLLGALIWRAAFLPRVLGALMAAGGLVYLVTSFVRFVAPGLYGTLTPAFLVCLVAELALALWLVVKGVDAQRWGRAQCP